MSLKSIPSASPSASPSPSSTNSISVPSNQLGNKINMGRGKCALGLIGGRKMRLQTFEKRKKGLEKKAYELSTLCDVKVAMIVLGPDDLAEGSNDPTIWPEDPKVVSKMISLYQEKQKTDQSCCRSVDVASIYQDKARLVQKEVEKLMKQNVDVKYESFSYHQLLQIGNELDNVLEGLKSRIDSMKTYQMFQETTSYGNRGKELDNYHQLQGLNSFNCFGNEGALVGHNSQTMKIKDEGPSYCNSYNNIVPANLDYFDPSLFGFGQNFEQNNNNITMDEGLLYCDSYNNNVPCNFDYHCPSLPGFGGNFEQNNENLIVNQPQPQYLSYTPAPMSVFKPEAQFLSYTPAPLQMSEFIPCPLSSNANYSQMGHGDFGDRSIDQIAGKIW